MANLKIKYELTRSGHGTIELLMFDYCKPDLAKDQQADNPQVFKSKKPYEVVTFEKYIEVDVLAHSTDPLFTWELKLWRMDDDGNVLKNITETPIRKTVDAHGHANYRENNNWRD